MTGLPLGGTAAGIAESLHFNDADNTFTIACIGYMKTVF